MSNGRPSEKEARLVNAAEEVAANQQQDSDTAGTAQGKSTESSSGEHEGGANLPTLHVGVEVNRLKIPSVFMATAGVLATLFLAWAVYKTLDLILLLFLALLIATAIEPIVNWLRRGPFNRSAGILIVYTGVFLVIGLILYLTVPVIIQQVGALGTNLNATVQDLRKTVNGSDSAFVRQEGGVLLDALGNVVKQSSATPANGGASPEEVQTATNAAITVATFFFSIITIFVVAFYWLTERTLIKRSLMSWLPARRANRIRRVWDDIEVKVGGWVRGQLTLMAIVGTISALGYLVIGLDFWPALGLFIFLAEIIPLVGPYIGTAPAVLVALTQQHDGGGIGKALIVVAFAVVLQTIEGNVLVPRIMRSSVGISPLTVIISILLGATLAGLPGALVAVPVAGSLQVIITDIKAGRESDEKLNEATSASAETRAESGELVVATERAGETHTHVESGATT